MRVEAVCHSCGVVDNSLENFNPYGIRTSVYEVIMDTVEGH
jgi:hypothetical protein